MKSTFILLTLLSMTTSFANEENSGEIVNPCLEHEKAYCEFSVMDRSELPQDGKVLVRVITNRSAKIEVDDKPIRLYLADYLLTKNVYEEEVDLSHGEKLYIRTQGSLLKPLSGKFITNPRTKVNIFRLSDNKLIYSNEVRKDTGCEDTLYTESCKRRMSEKYYKIEHHINFPFYK